MSVLLDLLITLHGKLPLSLNRVLGRFYGRLLYYGNFRITKTTFKNLDLCKPELSDREKKKLALRSCLHTGMAVTEAFYAWKQPAEKIVSQTTVANDDATHSIFTGANAIFISAHIGCWEILPTIIGSHQKCHALFKPSASDTLNLIMTEGRAKPNVLMQNGSIPSLKRIITGLSNNESLLIIADQEPNSTNGLFIPFFGRQAFTTTLPYKLAHKTLLPVIFIYALRTKKGWKISSEQLDFDQAKTEREFVQAMNQHFENIINKYLSQWEWGYKRFKTRRDDDRDLYPF